MGFEVQCSAYRTTLDVVNRCMSKSNTCRGVASLRVSRRSNLGKKFARSRAERELFQFCIYAGFDGHFLVLPVSIGAA